jgi:hypothetical protein
MRDLSIVGGHSNARHASEERPSRRPIIFHGSTLPGALARGLHLGMFSNAWVANSEEPHGCNPGTWYSSARVGADPRCWQLRELHVLWHYPGRAIRPAQVLIGFVILAE